MNSQRKGTENRNPLRVYSQIKSTFTYIYVPSDMRVKLCHLRQTAGEGEAVEVVGEAEELH